MTTKVRPATERFWEKVQGGSFSGCWQWTANVSGGYGIFVLSRRDVAMGQRRQVQAHRWAWEERNGPIPEGLQLDHLCRNQLCVNPDHLEPVTQRVNILRGNSAISDNAKKTHCLRGHEFTEANTRNREFSTGRIQRSCRACDKLWWTGKL